VFVLRVQAILARRVAKHGFLAEFQGISAHRAPLGTRHRFCIAKGRAHATKDYHSARIARPAGAQRVPTATGLPCDIFTAPGSCGEQNRTGGLKCQHRAFLV
jgi:hypothetical protein